MAKNMVFDRDARDALRRGVEKIADAVGQALGPRGRSAVIDKSWGAPSVTKDGASIAEEVELSDPHENMAAQLLREAASKTSDEAGDGTTTATVLAEAISLDGLRAVTAGADAMAVSRGIQKAAAAVAKELTNMARPLDIKDHDRLVQVGTIAADGDANVGEMLAEAFEKIGADGAIAVEEGKGIQTDIKIVEGMQFDRGFLSPHFVTDPKSVEAVLEDAFILIHEDKLSSIRKLIPLLEKLSKQKKSLLIIAEDVEGEALATLVVNKMRGILSCCAVKAPGYGDRRKAMMEDIAILAGGKAIFKDLGIDLEKVQPADLGRAKKVIVDADNTTIMEGAGKQGAVEERCRVIRREYEESDSEYDREKLQERLSRLSGGVAQINVGASSETELKERKKKVEDARSSVRAALEDGIVAGGGMAYLQAAAAIDKVGTEGDEKIGVDLVRKAVEGPFRRIVSNAGDDPSIVRRQIAEKGGDHGFDAVDPVKVARLALLNASSVSSLLLTAEAMISDIPEEEEKAPPGMPPGGMGGMGGMPPM
ncbi:MAG: chaperonin GroEL [Planctomycetota bacterium]|jgi:chaperonin GroEL